MIRSLRASALCASGNGRNPARRSALLTAVLSVVAGVSVASAQSRTWDNTGGLQAPDWQNASNIPGSAGIWDPANVLGDPAGAPTHWGGFTDVGAGNTGIFSGSIDPLHPTYAYFAEIANGATGTAGGLSVPQGNFIIPGYGNGGQGHGSDPSYIDVGTGTFNIDVASGALLALGYRFNQLSLKNSATITKTGGGELIDSTDLLITHIGAGTFTGKWDVQQGAIGLFFGSTSANLGDAGHFVADQLKVSNNAVVNTYQNNTAVQIGGNQGITIGSGGATFFSQGERALDAANASQFGAVVFNSKLTGGSPASPVSITWKSNVWDSVSTDRRQGFAQGGNANLYTDNHTTLFARWIINTGEIVPNGEGKVDSGLTANNDLGFGAVPASYLYNAITLDRDTTGTNATDIAGNAWHDNVLAGGPNIRIDQFGGLTIPVNRGIYLGPGGGGLHPNDAANPAHNILTVASIISGPGQLRALLNQAQAIVVLSGANTYTGGTWITAAAGATPQLDPTQSYLQVTTATLPPHQAGFTNTGTITAGQYTLPNSDVVDDGNLTFDQAFDGTYAGTISTSSVTSNTIAGNNNYTPIGNVTKKSGGVVFFTGRNTYIGNTTIGGGALVADTTDALPNYSSSAKVIVNSGAALAVTSTNWSSANVSAVRSSAAFNTGSYFGFNVPAAASYSYDTSAHPASAGIFKVGGGDLSLTGNSTGNGSLWVHGGKAILSPAATLGSAAGPITLDGGTLDITNNRLITTTAVGTFSAASYSADSISRYIRDGVLSSSTAAAQAGLTAVGVSTGARVKNLSSGQTATWGAFTVHDTDTLIMYTYAGDATLDAAINGDDFARIDSGFAGHLTGYDNGDFNLDGIINADDYFIIDRNYGRQTLGISIPAAPLNAVTAVPEPAGLALLATAVLATRGRRRATSH